MKISEIARRTGMAASAIRFYEERGLLVSVGRGSNGYRDYTEADVERLELVKIGKSLGFSLDDLGAFFAQGAAVSKPDLLRSLDQKLAEVEQMMALLNTQRRDLKALKDTIVATWESGECFKGGTLVRPAKTKPQTKPQATSKGDALPA